MKIVLFQPQIPQNTGNIMRTCAVTGSDLVLVRPMGFTVNDRWLKRAGLDYGDKVKIEIIDDLEEWLKKSTDAYYFFTSKSKKPYTSASYTPNDILIFGSETAGLPSFYHEQWDEKMYTIPMKPEVRCLNLATSVGIVLYEGLRQQNFQFIS